MHDINGKPFLMIAYEAIKNEGSHTSLMSEPQMRNNGLIVDSTSDKHIGVDGWRITGDTEFLFRR